MSRRWKSTAVTLTLILGRGARRGGRRGRGPRGQGHDAAALAAQVVDASRRAGRRGRRAGARPGRSRARGSPSSPTAQRVVDRHRQADLGRHVAIPSSRSAGRPPRTSKRSRPVQVAACRSMNGGSRRSRSAAPDVEEAGAPRAPQELAAGGGEQVAAASPRRRAGIWPADWQASSRKGTPASRHARPTSSAGFTRPPFVGTWVRATSRTRPSRRRAARRAVDGDRPVGVARHHLDHGPRAPRHLQEGEVVARVLGRGATGCGRPRAKGKA